MFYVPVSFGILHANERGLPPFALAGLPEARGDEGSPTLSAVLLISPWATNPRAAYGHKRSHGHSGANGPPMGNAHGQAHGQPMGG